MLVASVARSTKIDQGCFEGWICFICSFEVEWQLTGRDAQKVVSLEGTAHSNRNVAFASMHVTVIPDNGHLWFHELDCCFISHVHHEAWQIYCGDASILRLYDIWYIYGSVYPPLVNAISSRSRENYRAIRGNYRVIRDNYNAICDNLFK